MRGILFREQHEIWWEVARPVTDERAFYSAQAAPIRRRAKAGWRYIRRSVLRISKAECARICCVSRGTVERWEDPRSDSLPDVGHIGQLAMTLGRAAITDTKLLMGIRRDDV